MDRIDNDGYYQDVDDARWIERDIEREDYQQKPFKPYGTNETPQRYIGIDYNPASRNGRAKFCKERHRIHEKDRVEYLSKKANGEFDNLKPSQVLVECKNCKVGFVAKKADRKRGWARFCSKSCKAQY